MVAYLFKRHRHKQEIHRRFWSAGKDRGLKVKQLRFLSKLARKHRLSDPSLLLNSVYRFDRHVGKQAARIAERDPENPLLGLIGDMREKLGFDALDAHQPMRTSHQLEPGITLIIHPEMSDSENLSPWLVVGRDEQGVSATLMLREDRRQFRAVADGNHVSARFWRQQDTEYRFITEILSVDENSQTIVLKHAHDVERMQQRGFFRVAANFPLKLRILPAEIGLDGTEAAIALLDSTAGNDLTEEHGTEILPNGQEIDDAEEEDTVLDVDELPLIRVEVTDLSGGGLNVRTQDATNHNDLVLIDPDFEGSFPLAGILCKVLKDSTDPNGRTLQLSFVDLPPSVESAIVRTVYQHQIFEMTGEEIVIPEQNTLIDLT